MDKTKESSTIKTKKKAPLPLHVIILQEELARRARLNPQYSLRSFAKQLNIDASLLSKILKNQRKLTAINAKNIIKKCQMSPSDKKLFWSSLIQERENTFGTYDESSDQMVNEPKAIHEHLLPAETFQLISDPQHYVLTELTRTKNFKTDIQWISKKLNLSPSQTRETIHRLLKVGMISKSGDTLVRTPGRFTTSDKTITDSALKHHQRKILEQAIQAMDRTPIEKRSQNSM